MSKHRGYYTVGDFRPFLNNPAKFHNPDGKNLVARSGLEMRWFKKLDQLPNVLKWSSERVVVPYEKPIFATESDSYIIRTEEHKYIVDCWVLWQNGDQTVEMLVEIKPETMCYPPKEPKIANKKSLKNYHESMQTYLINRSKWIATERFCRSLLESKSRTINFVIFTEDKIESANKILGI
jgi:hypothetical protein